MHPGRFQRGIFREFAAENHLERCRLYRGWTLYFRWVVFKVYILHNHNILLIYSYYIYIYNILYLWFCLFTYVYVERDIVFIGLDLPQTLVPTSFWRPLLVSSSSVNVHGRRPYPPSRDLACWIELLVFRRVLSSIFLTPQLQFPKTDHFYSINLFEFINVQFHMLILSIILSFAIWLKIT